MSHGEPQGEQPQEQQESKAHSSHRPGAGICLILPYFPFGVQPVFRQPNVSLTKGSPNPILGVNLFLPRADGGRAVAQIGSLLPTVAIVGQLYDKKAGLQILIPVLGSLQRERPLRVIWGVDEAPPDKVQLLASIEPYHLKTTGDAAELLEKADILAIGPSSGETGLALRAMAVGTLVIATETVGLGTLCVHGTNALVVPPANARAFERALRAVLEDLNLRKRLVRAGLATARK